MLYCSAEQNESARVADTATFESCLVCCNYVHDHTHPLILLIIVILIIIIIKCVLPLPPAPPVPLL